MQRNRKIYTRVMLLNKEELPIQTVTGQLISGNINLDGTSAVRRSCSMQFTLLDGQITDYLWALKSKVKIEIGDWNEETDDIKWHKQGVYVLTSFSLSYSASGTTVALSGKDKMCLLNGELGGDFSSSIIFDSEDYNDLETGIITTTKIPIKTIIQQMLFHYAQESYSNIIINDLEQYGLELLEYRGDNNLYFIRSNPATADQSFGFLNVTNDEDMKVYVGGQATTIGQLSQYYPMGIVDDLPTDLSGITKFKFSSNDTSTYMAAKLSYGDPIGYRQTELTFPGELVGNIGENVTTILDKIANTFGGFEYFYDLDGHFIFQKKKNYIDIGWNGQEDPEQEFIDTALQYTKYAYEFIESPLVISYSNNPVISGVRNDFTVWGEYTGITGVNYPIHMRYAIDHRPVSYVSFAGTTYTASGSLDWREIIYQMALDYFKYKETDDFELTVAANNPSLYPTGKTGYEQYYTDMQGFWRQIYDPEADNGPWLIDPSEEPERLIFWLDFWDTNGELDKISVKTIGDRARAVNDTNVQAIYFKAVPGVIYQFSDDIVDTTSYKVVQLPKEMEQLVTISAKTKDAKSAINDLLYLQANIAESINLNIIPLYDLQPNSLIKVVSKKAQIEGDYFISNISFPLGYGGTMSINATKIIKRFV